MGLIIKLILVHVIVDFILQTDESVKHKRKHKAKSIKLYVHALLHGIGAFIMMPTVSFIWYALVIMVSHFFIDLGKIHKEEKGNERRLFFLDQLLHFVVIFGVWIFYTKTSLSFSNISTFINDHILLGTCLVLLTKPAAIFTRVFISKWSLEEDGNNTAEEDKTLAEAGMYIGILERLLIFGFIWVGKWEAIGFLLAAKSVFRFGDLKDTTDQNKTEYILIGTLTSFMLAILIGFAYVQLSPDKKENETVNENRIVIAIENSDSIYCDSTEEDKIIIAIETVDSNLCDNVKIDLQIDTVTLLHDTIKEIK